MAVPPEFKVLSGNTFLAVAHRQFTKCSTDTVEFVSPFLEFTNADVDFV